MVVADKCLKSFVGTRAYDKLNGMLTKTSLVNDLKKLSPEDQTSCLEGFHATLNHWHPKMINFSWLGTFCRYDYNYKFKSIHQIKVVHTHWHCDYN